MSEQSTLERTLEMMAMLSRPGGARTKTMAEHFEVSVRSIQRTIFTIKMAGYVVEEKAGYYKINHHETKRNNHFDIGDLLHFSKEEAWMLNEAIQKIPGKNAIKENLTKKLTSIYGAESMVKNMIKQEDSEQVRIIAEAIENKFQLIVNEYTYSTANRGLQAVVIEPIKFASDYSRLWAYYPKNNLNFLLRLSGINGVKATYKPYKFEHAHKVGFIDVFRGYGFSKTPITLILNNRAYGFMLEEFPMAKDCIQKLDKWRYEFKAEVCDFTPVARFYLGLPGNIIINGQERLKKFIDEFPIAEFDEDEFEYAVSQSSGLKVL